jgi:hypothetical protein
LLDTHEAASDPHPQYETSAEAQAKADQAETDAINWAKGYGLGTLVPEILDIDATLETGIYRFDTNKAGFIGTPPPSGNVFNLIVAKGGGFSQIASEVYSNKTFTRQKTSSGWSTWTTLWTGDDTNSGSVEYGSNANGKYVRYPNGVQEVWQVIERAGPGNNTFNLIGTDNFPASFVDGYISAHVSASVVGSSVERLTELRVAAGEAAISAYGIWNTTVATSQTVKILIYAIGRWK